MKKKQLGYVAVIAAWLVIWIIIDRLFGNRIFFAGPVETLRTLCGFLVTKSFWHAVGISCLHIGEGFCVGLAAACVLAACSARFQWIRMFLEPFVAFAKSVPVAAFVVLALLWFGAANLSVCISSLVVFPVLYEALMKGNETVDRKLLEAARIFRMSPVTVFREIRWPAIYPFFEQAQRVAFGMCWKSAIAAEVIAIAGHSIGEKLYDAKIYFETAQIFAWIVVIIALSSLTQAILRRIVLALKP